MPCTPVELQQKGEELWLSWQSCSLEADLDRMVEFAVALSSFSDFLEKQAVSGLQQVSRALEAQVLSAFDKAEAGKIPSEVVAELAAKVHALCERVKVFVDRNTQTSIQRRESVATEVLASFSPKARVWLVSDAEHDWDDFIIQLGYYGIEGTRHRSCEVPMQLAEPNILLIDARGADHPQAIASLQTLRSRFAAAKLISYLQEDDFNAFKEMLRAGADYCFSTESSQAVVLNRMIDLCSTVPESPYRVLIVEDSRTAIKSIQIALGKGGMTSFAVANPADVLSGMRQFEPDLVLMDMYMPDCTGVEATRVIRQHPEFLSTPVVYLSGDGDMALQVDALRLGGDHFLTKPFNPVLLNAVVKSKIERYRNLRKAMECDGLTGLFNHRTIKERLQGAVREAQEHNQDLTVAMIDIDQFKAVNDTYGHPAGDQVLRSLAWLLKLNLRTADLVGRYGGEEFLVGLVGASPRAAFDVVNRIRLDFSRIRHPFDAGWFSVTFSAGLSYATHFEQMETLVKQADTLLYQAKESGRNCVLPLI